MRDGIDDESYQNTFVPIVSKVMESYQPSAVVLQCGADSLSGDRLGCFNLTLKGHAKCVEFMKKYNLPLMLLGGGGYTIRNVARCWTYETAVALNVEIANELPYNDYFEYFGPDFKLHISPSNMANQNTPEYMDKIKTRLFENLRMLPHAPGVQMANIPEDGVPLKEESEALDEANPDKRLPQQIKDKIVEADNEFEDSTKSGNKNESDANAANTTSSANDSSVKTKGSADNVSDTASKKLTENTDASKNTAGKEEKEEPMDVDSAEKDDKNKSAPKTSDSSSTTTTDSKSSTKEQPSVAAS